jgi:nucleoside-diphosphate-sugar epimerase
LILVDEFKERGLSLVIDAPKLEGPRPPIKRSVPDISRLESLGFTPATTIAQGFRRTVRSYEEFS